MPPDQEVAVAPALRELRESQNAMWRLDNSDMAVALEKSTFGGGGIGANAGLSESVVAANILLERTAFLERLPLQDQADIILSLSQPKSRASLLDALHPIERSDVCAEIGMRHSRAFQKMTASPAERATIVAKLPAAAVASMFSECSTDMLLEIFAAIGSAERSKLMKRIIDGANLDVAASVFGRLTPRLAAEVLHDTPPTLRAAMLLPMERPARERIVAEIASIENTKTIQSNEHELTRRAITEARQRATSWEESNPGDVAGEILSGQHHDLLVVATLNFMDPNDATLVLEALAEAGGDEMQEMYLARLPKRFRSIVLEQLGGNLARRLAHVAVTRIAQSNVSVISAPSQVTGDIRGATVVARLLSHRSRNVAAAALASMEPAAARNVLALMRPQHRASATAALSPSTKALIVAQLGTAVAAAALVASLAKRDRIATLLLLGKDTQAAILAGLSPEDQRQVLEGLESQSAISGVGS